MKPKLLIVEDNELTSSLLFTIFESLGFDLAEISDGLKVIPFLEKNKIDVMILDLELPGMTGDQIYSAVKDNPTLKYIPIIPFTAHCNSQSPDSYSSKIIWTEYQKTGKIPTIVYKFEQSQDSQNLTQEIIDAVSKQLLAVPTTLPFALREYYVTVRGGEPEKILQI